MHLPRRVKEDAYSDQDGGKKKQPYFPGVTGSLHLESRRTEDLSRAHTFSIFIFNKDLKEYLINI